MEEDTAVVRVRVSDTGSRNVGILEELYMLSPTFDKLLEFHLSSSYPWENSL